MKKSVFLDANVVIDLLGEREKYYEASAKVATLADHGKIKIVVSTLTYAIAHYLISKFESTAVAKEKIRKFKVLAETSDLTDDVVEKSLSSGFTDFEDGLQYYSALNSNCDLILTRNLKDFKESKLPVFSPDSFLAAWR